MLSHEFIIQNHADAASFLVMALLLGLLAEVLGGVRGPVVAESSSTWSCCGAAAVPSASRSGASPGRPSVRFSLAAKQLCSTPSGSVCLFPSSLQGYVLVSSLPRGLTPEVTLCSGTLLSMSRLRAACSKFRFFSVLPQLTYSPVPSLLSCLGQLPLSLCNPLLASSVRLLLLSFSGPVFLHLCICFIPSTLP